MTVSVLGAMRLTGSLVLDNDTGVFPSNPKVGTMHVKGETLYTYLTIAGVTNWFPLARLPERYVHVQSAPLQTWVVQHNLNNQDVWYQIQDSNGQITTPADFVKIDDNTFNLVFTEPMQGKVLVLATGLDGNEQPGVTIANIMDWPTAVSAAEVAHLDGVTSSIQTQLNTLTAGLANVQVGPISLSSLTDWPTSVSATEVGYLDGVTSAIQTQLDTKQTAAQVDARIQLVVGTAPAALDTLGEIAAQLAADETAAAALTNTVSLKADKTYVDAGFTALNASNLTTGTVPTARLGAGTANSTTYLRGDGTWATVSGGAGTPGGADTQVQYNSSGAFAGSASFTFNSATGVVSATGFAGNGSELTALNASNLTSGSVPVARLGSGTADSSTYLRGDGTWVTLSSTATNLTATSSLAVNGLTTGTFVYVTSSRPYTTTVNTNAPAGARVTDYFVNNADGSLNWRLVADGNGAAANWMTVTRSGNTATNITLTSTAITLNGAVTSNTSFIAPLYSGTNAATGGNITVRGGNGSAGNGGTLTLAGGTATGTAGSVSVQTAGTTRLTVDATGAWLVGGSAGTANYVLSSNGAGAAPTWKAATAVVLNATGTVAMPVITTSSINAGINNGTGAPQMLFTNSGAAADTKTWYWNLDSSGTLTLNALNDANSAGSTAISLARTGTTVNSITLSATDVIMAGATFNSNVKVGSRASAAASGSMLYGSNGSNNFHIDSGNSLLLNYYSGTNGVIFGNGAGASSGASVSSAGLVTAKTLSVTSGVTSVFFPTTDNSIALGGGSNRWSVVYAGTGTINTSDGNLKQDVAELDEVEKRVALRLKALIRKFRFKDAVAEKGDAARIHVGAIAQDVEGAFILEGLDPEHYAVFCKDTWIDDEGVEQTRLGIRYDEMFAFIISIL